MLIFLNIQQESPTFHLKQPQVIPMYLRELLEESVGQSLPALKALSEGKYRDAIRLSGQLRGGDPAFADAVRGCAYAMQRDYQRAIPDLQRAANALKRKPRHETVYESVDAMHIASLSLVGQHKQAIQRAKGFNREVARVYAKQYPRLGIQYGILFSLMMPEAAFTQKEVDQLIRYEREDPAHEVRAYVMHERVYLQARRREYRPALANLRKVYTDRNIAVNPPEPPDAFTLMLEAYMHLRLSETNQTRQKLREAERALQNEAQTEDPIRLFHACALSVIGRQMFPRAWQR